MNQNEESSLLKQVQLFAIGLKQNRITSKRKQVYFSTFVLIYTFTEDAKWLVLRNWVYD